ncbi:MAG: rhomboid family intramembrane serine protease, partial [Candidatus Lokiarchaeota archaeon]|nr:rhomboid family intramembrane serine protease [Candidatus Lokiarchaeota archaeon]
SFNEYSYYFVQINDVIFRDFEIWRLFTAMFIHGDLIHLFSNMFGLFLFGVFVESFFSRKDFLLIYFVSGLLGNIFSLFLLPSYIISFGASGAVFGLIGASLIIVIKERYTPLIFISLVYVLYFLVSSFTPGINYFAHIFGLIGGLLLGYFFQKANLKQISY